MKFLPGFIAAKAMAVLTIALFFYSCSSPSSPSLSREKPDVDLHEIELVSTGSGPISPGWADTLRKRYVSDSIHQLKIDSNTIKVPLQGFVYDAGSLNTIINNNSSGVTPDKVIFYLGQDTGKSNPPKWHIIAYGMKNDTLLQTSSKNSKAPPSVMDKAVPCPPNCPTK